MGLKIAWSWTVCLLLQCLASGFQDFFFFPLPFLIILAIQIYNPGSSPMKNLCTLLLTAVLQKCLLYSSTPSLPKRKPGRKTNPQTKTTIQIGYDLTWQSKCWQWCVLSGCCRLCTGSQPTFFLLHEDLTVTPGAEPHGIRA